MANNNPHPLVGRKGWDYDLSRDMWRYEKCVYGQCFTQQISERQIGSSPDALVAIAREIENRADHELGRAIVKDIAMPSASNPPRDSYSRYVEDYFHLPSKYGQPSKDSINRWVGVDLSNKSPAPTENKLLLLI